MKKLFVYILFFSTIYAQSVEQDYYQHLIDQFESASPPENQYLKNEIDIFMHKYPQSRYGDNLLFCKAKLQMAEPDTAGTILQLTKICFLYPQSNLVPEVIKYLSDYLNENYHQIRSSYIEGIHHISKTENMAIAFNDYLHYVYQFSDTTFYHHLLKDIDYFLSDFSIDAQVTVKVLYLKGNVYSELKMYKPAAFVYSRIFNFFPASSFVTLSMFKTGEIYGEQLNKPDKALNIFIRLVTEFNDSLVTGDAQFKIAEIYDIMLNNKQEAQANYRLFISAYPTNKNIGLALFRLAHLLLEEQKYEESIAAFIALNEIQPDSTLHESALWQISEMYYNNLDNYEKAAETYLQYAEKFPENKKTASALSNAAQIFEKNLNDLKQAQKIYKKIVKEYKDSAEAIKAEIRLKKIRKS